MGLRLWVLLIQPPDLALSKHKQVLGFHFRTRALSSRGNLPGAMERLDYMGVFKNGGTPQNTPKMIILNRKTQGFVGETHHFRNPSICGLCGKVTVSGSTQPHGKLAII